MEKFEKLTGIAASLPYENINTDAVIPVRWIVNYGWDLGEGLFGGWRYDAAGKEKPDFILNQPPFRQARILLAGRNFGCGSSREEAVWALVGFGIRCVIAPSFGDIFFENSFKNSLLPIRMSAADMAAISSDKTFAANAVLSVDLRTCRVTVPGGTADIAFAVEESRRKALLMGLDHIDLTLLDAGEIAAFQARDRSRRSWIYRSEQKHDG
jgi:3-isopropylmalate/(R)-2-methylmalate dehydratase small subunit